MFVSVSNLHKIGSQLRIGSLAAALAVAAILATSLPAPAQNTRLWTQSKIEEFEKGTPQGVALTSDGHLRQGPSLTEILTSPSTFVWSVAVDAKGTAWLGTASPATVLRVGKDGKPFTLFETRDLSVQVVRLGPDGSLYAATLPSGKVYRLKADSATKQDDTAATVVFDPAKLDDGKSAGGKSDDKTGDGKPSPDKPESTSHYIWDMTFDASGRLYIATGGPAAVYRVNPTNTTAKPEAFFKSDEEHIRSLAWDANGNLIAGSDGSGLVYRIDPQGKGYVLFEAPRREITAVAVSANGTIYAASVGDKSRNPLPPLPLSGVGTVTITVVQPGSMQAANTSTALPEGTEIYALTEGQAPRKLWSGKDEIIYALTARPEGLLALTGNRGRIFKIADDGSFADVGRLDAQQGLSMTAAPGKDAAGRIFIGTGNTGKLIALGVAEKHEYASDVLDAGALSRFGRVEVDPGSTGYEFFTRSGNVEQPVRGWSNWSPLKDGTVASPAGRFLQWKAVLATNAVLGSVGVNYLPVNSVPVVDEVVVVPGARASAPNQPPGMAQPITIALPSANAAGQGVTINFDGGPSVPLQAIKDRTAITVRWAAHDDDSDDLIYSLYLRGDGESVWRLLKDTITDKFYTFDATLIPDGGYQIKVVASDAPSHTPGDSLTGEKVSDRFEVDTTPPVVTALTATVESICAKAKPCGPAVHALFDAEDAFTAIAHAEYSLDAGPWQFINPVGGLSDSRHEHYDFVVPTPPDAKMSEHLITVRVYDRHDNVGVAKTVVHAAGTAPSR
jgi:streptogramin lyase